jgi:hypothetical protein
MNVIPETHGTLDKYLPLLLALMAALLVGRTLRKTLWSAFALYMALHYSGIHPFG